MVTIFQFLTAFRHFLLNFVHCYPILVTSSSNFDSLSNKYSFNNHKKSDKTLIINQFQYFDSMEPVHQNLAFRCLGGSSFSWHIQNLR